MNSLHISTLRSNQTEVRYGFKYVLFSYQTPVAYSDEQGRVFVTGLNMITAKIGKLG